MIMKYQKSKYAKYGIMYERLFLFPSLSLSLISTLELLFLLVVYSHMRVKLSGIENIQVIDDVSTNGTKVNGKKIASKM